MSELSEMEVGIASYPSAFKDVLPHKDRATQDGHTYRTHLKLVVFGECDITQVGYKPAFV
jgi:hypothetical protein